MNTIKRPKSITIIGWIIVIIGIIGILGIGINHINPSYREMIEKTGKSYSRAIVMGIISCTITIIAGIAILKQMNWGRIVFISLYPLLIIIETIIDGFDPTYIVSIVVAAIFTYFLTRREANDFFKKGNAADNDNKSEKTSSIPYSSKTEEGNTISPVSLKAQPIRPVGTLRNVTGIICIVFGGMFLLTLSMVLFMFLDESKKDALGSMIITFLLLSLLPIGLGVLLRGFTQWRMSLGLVLAVNGGLLLMLAITIPLAMLSPSWDVAMQSSSQSVPPEEMNKTMSGIIKGGAFFGIIYSALGFILIYIQNKINKGQHS